ncbi:MAG: AIPR family protein [Thalassobaculaceae bacterium]|uniref:AIPR family protein n=1 Tax=Roseitalea porphyridii TaxID=1852022 RepID=UPI0032ED12E4
MTENQEAADLSETLSELEEEIALEAAATNDLKAACFFRIMHDTGVENGDFPDLDYTPAIRETSRDGYRIDGVCIDPERREVHLAVCDYRQSGEMETLDLAGYRQIFSRARRFFDSALKPEFISSLEEMSSSFEAAYPIYEQQAKISRIRIVILSNARLATRKKTVDSDEHNGRTFTYSILDLSRYADIQKAAGGTEALEIDIAELNDGNPLPCLKAYGGGNGYESYLVAMPGKVLAEIYGRYGARLLEQNVRAFLQAKTKVNRGIIETISGAPERFFAYNNGLTVTASGIETRSGADGSLGIAGIRDMQIVNGGQTTASVLYAKDLRRAELGEVFVQMKLSVVDPEHVEEIVPKISRFANTQNRISEADFFSGHPFHVSMERFSRRLSVPVRDGALHATRWFYERARGQYADRKNKGSSSNRKKFETEFPKHQVITKTDAAKYQLTFARKPHFVSQGAQKCFMRFAESVSERWTKSEASFNEKYFRDMVSRAIIFRWCDAMIGQSEWYVTDRGYKAPSVTYTIAYLNHRIRESERTIDLDAVWAAQAPGVRLQEALSRIAPVVAAEIRNAPPELKNIGEYTKRELCWTRVRALDIDLPEELERELISEEERKHRVRSARDQGSVDMDIGIEVLAMKCTARSEDIREYARSRGFLSPNSNRALDRISRGQPLPTPDANAFANLVKLMKKDGYEFPSAPDE